MRHIAIIVTLFIIVTVGLTACESFEEHPPVGRLPGIVPPGPASSAEEMARRAEELRWK